MLDQNALKHPRLKIHFVSVFVKFSLINILPFVELSGWILLPLVMILT